MYVLYNTLYQTHTPVSSVGDRDPMGPTGPLGSPGARGKRMPTGRDGQAGSGGLTDP